MPGPTHNETDMNDGELSADEEAWTIQFIATPPTPTTTSKEVRAWWPIEEDRATWDAEDAEIVEEMGQEWFDRHKGLLDMQWEYIMSL